MSNLIAPWDYRIGKRTGLKSTVKGITPTAGSAGKVIHTGPRGGKYYINSKGKKTYIKKKK